VRTLLNIIWLVLSGFWLAVGYVLAGVIMCVLIITMIPMTLWPFGRAVVDADAVSGAYAQTYSVPSTYRRPPAA
jgi:uncharacterized membrane protein YccF (DUF307 family)